MIKFSRICFAVLMGACVLANAGNEQAAAPQPAPAPEIPLPTDPVVIKTDSSYAVGFQLGRVFLQQLGSRGVVAGDIDLKAMNEGFLYSVNNGELDKARMDQLSGALQALDKQLQARKAKIAEANAAAGKTFLDENKQKPGVTTTASGLQYEVLKAGSGPKYAGDGKDGAQFRVRYEGRLIDGNKFDGDMQGEPATFTLQVIPGFREALMTMPTGSIWRLFIPAELGYGDQGAGTKIPPGSALIFDLELVEIQKAPAEGAPPVPGE